ncbi:MAG: hypothetical protein COV59_02305 [Candidatus Magasanikbacteria bacterium CG11_big_fil_rev_8_21_14_0_20_39_34]|uniref:Nucleotidase n=1 Tax=Candidatus Magasanikbacteria bacterium CG11_big_fil_rev_8_21_14_0_20_39_34 TaxID=1974653 RepID=A0A2H0N523_9BACT|nr:MAG: hypothetical protein COV59_02305 [Candidatus Magasanikbacteria bacterium CG11_big_fil_rev_8_21_14_0_20_39_34]
MIEDIQKGIALDIDDTLSITHVSWYQGLMDTFGNPENLTIQEIAKKYSHSDAVPYWESEEVIQWKIAKYYDVAGYKNLPIIENAHHLVERISQFLPISCYLTARPESTREVTQEWLQKHGFPEIPLIMKPTELGRSNHNPWKASILAEYEDRLLGIIDDNPGLIASLPPTYDGTVFLYSHLDYPHDTTINVIPCKDWDSVYLEIFRMARLFGKI